MLSSFTCFVYYIKVTSIITVTKDEATKQNTFYENQTGKGLVAYISFCDK